MIYQRYSKTTQEENDPARKIIESLLDNNADPNKTDIYGLKALHHAAMRDNGDIVRILVTRGGHIDCVDKQHSTPLHIAATYGNTKVVEVLMVEGANIRLKDEKGQTPLHKTALSGNPETVEKMLDCIDIEILKEMIGERDRDGNTPIMLAIASGIYECMQKIVSRCGSEEFMAVSNNHGEYPIHLGVRSGSLEIIKLLSSHGANLNQTNSLRQTPVYLAAECPRENDDGTGQSLDVMRFLVEK